MAKARYINFLPKSGYYSYMDSPVGKLTIITSINGLHAVLWDCDLVGHNWDELLDKLIFNDNDRIILNTKKQLLEYFEGIRKTFDLPLVLNGTKFQMDAWNELIKIPYATKISYANQAAKIGNSNKARAVGMANRLNPISIIIPCHRVVGSNGKLVGFAGGIDRKSYLIDLERENQ